jgi:hypothetical protein
MGKGYQGHPSRNAWNVALWLGNDEGLYRQALALKRRHGTRRAAELMKEELPSHTPDGCPYSVTTLRLANAGLE